MDVCCFRSRLGFNYSFNVSFSWTALLLVIGFASVSLLSTAVDIAPRVNKDKPYDAKTSSCFFQGLFSLYKEIYNIDGNICLYFHGRLELDADMVETELEEIVFVEGCLIINGTRIRTAYLSQIKYFHANSELCGYKYALIIYGNPYLTEVVLDDRLTIGQSDIFIRMNPLLSELRGTLLEIDIGADTGDCDVSSVNTDTNCSRVIGDVNFKELSPIILQRIQVIEGTLLIESAQIHSLEMLEGLRIIGSRAPALTVSHNKQLVDISALLRMEIESDMPAVRMVDNPSICHNIAEKRELQSWLDKNGASVHFSDKCLMSCRGGKVTNQYVSELHKHCSSIKGNLLIEGLNEIPANMSKLEQLEEVHGRVVVRNNNALKNMLFLKNVREIRNEIDKDYSKSLLVYENPNLKRIQLNKNLQLDVDEVFIRVNPKLSHEGIENAAFSIDIGEITDCSAKTLHKDFNCTRIIGDVDFVTIPSQMWEAISTVEGTLRIEGADITNLDRINNLTIVGWRTPALKISKNRNLVDISALLTVTIVSKTVPLQISENPHICHNIVERRRLSQYLQKNNASVTFTRECLKSCDGGRVDQFYLGNLEKHCVVVDGDLLIENLEKLPLEITKLRQIERITGRLIVANNIELKKLDFFENLAEISNKKQKGKRALMIYGNNNLTEVEFSGSLNLSADEIYIKFNPKLSQISMNALNLQWNFSDEKGCTVDSLVEDEHCKTVVGEINFENIPYKKWQQIEAVEGVIIVRNSSIHSLDFLKNLTIVGWESPALIISGNDKLVDISALLTIIVEVENPAVEISDNPNICDNVVQRKKLKEWLTLKGAEVRFNTNCLKECSGGVVTEEYLSGLSKHCNMIKGELLINGTEVLPSNIDKLKQIQKIDGRLIVVDSLPLKFLPVFKNLREVNGKEFNESTTFSIHNNTFKMIDSTRKTNTTKTTAVIVYEEKKRSENSEYFAMGKNNRTENISRRESRAKLVEISEVDGRPLKISAAKMPLLSFELLDYQGRLVLEKNGCGYDLKITSLAVFILLMCILDTKVKQCTSVDFFVV